uniref:Ig-like domain-containing protein n=1 Tax=Branchiostoma floridae TaxID=7739 RepID=C3ZMB0_BRAFL|eukprot:XP_002590355.1 hypothetical protein BRAFLDRAFT_76615 [Branchiostoma floridae]
MFADGVRALHAVIAPLGRPTCGCVGEMLGTVFHLAGCNFLSPEPAAKKSGRFIITDFSNGDADRRKIDHLSFDDEIYGSGAPVVGDVQKGEFHLRIQDANLEDRGAYTCNVFGLEPKEAMLTVVDPPSVAVPIASVHVIEGDSADLTCLVDSNPPATISWTRPGRPALLSGNIG